MALRRRTRRTAPRRQLGGRVYRRARRDGGDDSRQDRGIRAGRKLVVEDISYEPAAGEPLSGIRLELTIAERESGCLVTVAQDVPDEGPAYVQYRGEAESGWESSLEDLKKYLEGPRRRRITIEAGLPTN